MTSTPPSRMVGVLGGMGPAATADFYARLVRATPARVDQDHLRVVIWGDPTVPDRIAAVRGTGPSPVPALAHGIRVLADAGATVLAVPCNTVHVFIPEALRAAGVNGSMTWVNMIERTVERVSSTGSRRVGLLATLATLEAGMYDDVLRRSDLQPVHPRPDAQKALLGLIAAVKRGVPPNDLTCDYALVAADLAQQGADHVVVACTEVSVVAPLSKAALPTTDAMDVLLTEVLAEATHA